MNNLKHVADKGPKPTDSHACRLHSIGYVSKPLEGFAGLHGIFQRFPETREPIRGDHLFTGFREELIFGGTEQEVEKCLQGLLQEAWDRQFEIDAKARWIKKRKKR